MRMLALALIACSPSLEADSAGPPAEPVQWPLTLGGDRPAEVRGPADWTGEEPLPLVLLLHGYGATAAVQDALLGFTERIDSDRFLLVLPEGTKDPDGAQFWNATDACCDFYDSGVDDVGYLSELLDEIAATVAIDADRIYATGHSNGGFMSYRLACEQGDRFAAIAPLAGAMWQDPARCPASEPVSLLHIHGTEDDSVLYEGIPDAVPGAQASAEFWAALAGCTTSSAAGELDLVDSAPAEETSITAWEGCSDGLSTELWTMHEVDHIPLVNDSYAEEVLRWLLAHSR